MDGCGVDPDDSVHNGTDGKLMNRDLAKVCVMGKKQGWGDKLPDNLKNGDWVYAAYAATSKPLMEDCTKCRACHTPPAQKDFVHRYNEYVETRGRMEPHVTGFIPSWERGCKLVQYISKPIHRSIAVATHVSSL